MSGKSIPAALLLQDRLSLKFAALFATAFLAVFGGGLVYDIFATRSENQQTDADSLTQPALKPIEPKIESDLAKVLTSNSLPDAVEIKDPFSDKGGISSNVKTSVGTSIGTVSSTKPATQQLSAAQGSSVSGPGTTGNSVLKIPPQINPPQINPQMSEPLPAVNYIASPEATNARIRVRQERIRLGQDGGPESAVLAIDDLLPVGVVSGGNGETEIMLYSQVLARTFSFPVGTRFLDGWLVDWRPEGVGFGYTSQNGAVFLKNWSRSVKQPTDNNSR
jgi:hypothetical protein